MTGMEFDPVDLEDEAGEKPDGAGEGEGGDAKPSSTVDFRVPDDYEDEDLRGLSGKELLNALKHSKELTKRAIEQANSASGAALASANAANAAAASGVKGDPPAPTALTKEDLLVGDPETVNKKIDAIFAEKARPILVEQYTKMTHQALALARHEKDMPYWNDYENEIIQEAKSLTLDVTANLSTWKHLYGTVTARHQSDIIEKEIARRSKTNEDDETDLPPETPSKDSLVGRKVSVGSTGERGKGGKSGGDKTQKLSDEQRAAARALGVPEEEYAAYLPEEE